MSLNILSWECTCVLTYSCIVRLCASVGSDSKSKDEVRRGIFHFQTCTVHHSDFQRTNRKTPLNLFAWIDCVYTCMVGFLFPNSSWICHARLYKCTCSQNTSIKKHKEVSYMVQSIWRERLMVHLFTGSIGGKLCVMLSRTCLEINELAGRNLWCFKGGT